MPATNELLQEGRYRIDQPAIGSGSMYEAYDTVRNTNVIVTEIPVKLNKVATVSQRESLNLAFATQAKALTEIDHDALPHVHDFFSEIDRQYLVMESVEGTDLRKLLKSTNKAFAIAKVTEWADQLLDALNYLHTRKPSIIHGNIRPENLIVTSAGKVKLLGVGLDSVGDPELMQGSQVDTGVLRYAPMEFIWPGLDPASQKVITNSYDERSERILKGPADARSDIYSLGATLYFLITGTEPVDPLERSIDVLEGKLDPLREPTKVNSQIPPELSDVLMKALEIKRENRYDSALIMRQVLQTSLESVTEREDEELLDQKEAAEIIRLAAQAKSESALEAERNEALERQRKEAEAQRRMAEQRAEAEKQLREKEEAERVAAAEAERSLREKEEAERAAAAERQLRETQEAERSAAEADRQLRERQEAERVAAEEERKRREKEEAARAAAEAETRRREKEEAERVAAAAERRRRETEEAERAAAAHAAEVVAYKETEDVNEDELAAVLKEIEEAESSTKKDPQPDTPVDNDVDAVYVEADADDDVQVIESPVDMAPEPSVHSDEDDEIFSNPEKSGRSLPMPAIAGAIGLMLVVGVGGWFVMSGTSDPARSEQIQTAPVTDPAPVEPAPADTITSTATEAQPETVSVDPATQDPGVTAQAAATPKGKKAEAKPQPEKKKAVTVDDLINDN